MNTVFLVIQDAEGVPFHSVYETLDKAISALKSQIQKDAVICIDNEIGDRHPYYFSINPPLKLRATTYFSEWSIVECPVL